LRISGKASLPRTKSRKLSFDDTRIREDADNYVNSVLAVLALVNELRWDSGKRLLRSSTNYEIGRRMTTSANNTISPETQITPDFVVQESKYGVIGEITYSLAQDEAGWLDKLKQLRKYDDDLLGWWTPTEKLPSHDIACLVQFSRMVMVSDILAKHRRKKKTDLKFESNLAIVGFNRSSGATQEYMSLIKNFGELSDKTTSERLRKSVQVPLERLVIEYKDKKFVDFEPPMAYLLQILWENLFTSYLDECPYDEEKGYAPIPVTVDRVTDDLQKAYGFSSTGPRSPEVPKKRWIRRALDHLVVFRFATKIDEEYTIKYRRIKRGDPITRFGKLIYDNRGKLALSDMPQPTLFDSQSDTPKAASSPSTPDQQPKSGKES
jgi:hypothetical protein